MNHYFIRPRHLAEMLHIDAADLIADIEAGKIVAVMVEGEWAIPRKQALQIMGAVTKRPVMLYEPDEIVH